MHYYNEKGSYYANAILEDLNSDANLALEAENASSSAEETSSSEQ